MSCSISWVVGRRDRSRPASRPPRQGETQWGSSSTRSRTPCVEEVIVAGEAQYFYDALRSPGVGKAMEDCTKPHPTIHWASTKKGIGRGLELLSEDGRLRGGASQWRNRLRETEGSVAGCFLKKTKHSDK